MSPLDHALRLADRDVAIFPCRPADKSPLVPHGFHDASTNPDLGRFWWRCWPDALVGAPTGDRFVVLDIDRQYEPAQRWYEANRRRLPLTRTHHTRSGGLHLLFKPNPLIKCSTGKIEKNIDTRGAGGYVIFWPAHGLAVENATVLADAPDWLLEALTPPSPPAARAGVRPLGSVRAKVDGIIRAVARSSEGERNTVAFWAGCRLAELAAQNAISRDYAIDLIIAAAARAGLAREEARRTALSAFRKNHFGV